MNIYTICLKRTHLLSKCNSIYRQYFKQIHLTIATPLESWSLGSSYKKRKSSAFVRIFNERFKLEQHCTSPAQRGTTRASGHKTAEPMSHPETFQLDK